MSTAQAAWRSPRGFVGNVAEAIALAAMSDNAVGRIYNVAEQPSYAELEWATRAAAAAGWKGAFVVLPPDEMPPHLRMPGKFEQHWSVDTSRIRSELGYREPVDLDDAIARTIAWERANAHRVRSRRSTTPRTTLRSLGRHPGWQTRRARLPRLAARPLYRDDGDSSTRCRSLGMATR